MPAATTEILTPTSVEDGQDRAARRQRSTAARTEFIDRMTRAYNAEAARDENAFDAENLLDRLRDALTNPLSPETFNGAIQGIAADLFGDDRWAAR